MIQSTYASTSRGLLGKGNTLAICAAFAASLGFLYAIPSSDDPIPQARAETESVVEAGLTETVSPPARPRAKDSLPVELKVADEPAASAVHGSRATQEAILPEATGSVIQPPSEPEVVEPRPEPEVVAEAPATEAQPEARETRPAAPTQSATPERKSAPKVVRKEQRSNRKAPAVDWRKTADAFLGCANAGCDSGDIARHVDAITSRF